MDCAVEWYTWAVSIWCMQIPLLHLCFTWSLFFYTVHPLFAPASLEVEVVSSFIPSPQVSIFFFLWNQNECCTHMWPFRCCGDYSFVLKYFDLYIIILQGEISRPFLKTSELCSILVKTSQWYKNTFMSKKGFWPGISRAEKVLFSNEWLEMCVQAGCERSMS